MNSQAHQALVIEALDDITQAMQLAKPDSEMNQGARAFGALAGLGAAVDISHSLAKHSGWWDEWATIPKEYQLLWISTKLLLVNSEVIEGFEGARKDLMDDHLPHRKMLEVELADAAIRIFDLAGGLGLDVAGAIIEKLAYNQRRADHKREHRAAEGGKKV